MFRLFGLLLVGLVLAGCDPERTYLYSNSNTGTKIMVSDVIGVAKPQNLFRGSNPERIASSTDGYVCSSATKTLGGMAGEIIWDSNYTDWIDEAKRRGLDCDVGNKFATYNDDALCTNIRLYQNPNAEMEAKRRGLSCAAITTTAAPAEIAQSNLIWKMGDGTLCNKALIEGQWDTRPAFIRYVQEAKRRGLSCGVSDASTTQTASATTAQSNTSTSVKVDDSSNAFNAFDDEKLCFYASWKRLNKIVWSEATSYVQEAKRRGLSCGVEELTGQITNASVSNDSKGYKFSNPNYPQSFAILFPDSKEIFLTSNNKWFKKIYERVKNGRAKNLYVHIGKKPTWNEVKPDSFSQIYSFRISSQKNIEGLLLELPKRSGGIDLGTGKWLRFCIEAIEWHCSATFNVESAINQESYQMLSQVIGGTSTTQIASATTSQSNTPSSAELEAERQKRIKLEQQLAALKAQQKQKQQTISSDTQIPLITIASADTKGKKGVIRGRVSDNVGVAEVTIDGNALAIQSNGSFEYSTFVPATGLTVTVLATDMAGLSSKQTVSLQRNVNLASATISFDRLNPIGKRTKQNNNALALIIGVADYENTPAKAVFADADAMMFRDYASEKLGIPDSRIKTMVNDSAGERELLLSVKSWLSRSVKQNQSDVYIFFAGHGLASDDGSKMYLLPYDGAPELLDDTAILRDRLFSDVAAANPRSVTVFLDTCYSGTTRGTDMLIASRPIAIRALEQSIPDNFTVMTAAAGDQTAKPLEEAKHGMFSYFLMKGMEGEADANNDNEITAGELHSYVQTNVIQQSSGSQTPELQGDADRVLVRFQ